MRSKWDETDQIATPDDTGAPELCAAEDEDYEYDAETLAAIEELNKLFTPEEIETGTIDREFPTHGALVFDDLQELWDRLMTRGLADSLGTALRIMRERHDLSLADAAEAQGISRARAHQIEQPNANLQLDTILRAASAYGYHVQVVFTPKDGKGQPIAAKLAWVD